MVWPTQPVKLYLYLVLTRLVTWLMNRLMSCEPAHEPAQDFTLFFEPQVEPAQALDLNTEP